jgi:hypothetical protein
MSVELHRPPKPEESQKNSKFFYGKTIPYPGLEPRTPGLAVLTTAPLRWLKYVIVVFLSIS